MIRRLDLLPISKPAAAAVDRRDRQTGRRADGRTLDRFIDTTRAVPITLTRLRWLVLSHSVAERLACCPATTLTRRPVAVWHPMIRAYPN